MSKISDQVKIFIKRITYPINLHISDNGHLESVYQTLFERDLASVSLKNRYYPVGGAANYSLLYVILRTMIQLKPSEVMELGAGQSTLLLDDYVKNCDIKSEIVTLESNKWWCDNIQKKVDHQVIFAETNHGLCMGKMCELYDYEYKADGTIELLIVDGPMGMKKYSRMGFMQFVHNLNLEKCVVVIDDTNRPAEYQTVTLFKDYLDQNSIDYKSTQIKSYKQQTVFGIGDFIEAGYF